MHTLCTRFTHTFTHECDRVLPSTNMQTSPDDDPTFVYAQTRPFTDKLPCKLSLYCSLSLSLSLSLSIQYKADPNWPNLVCFFNILPFSLYSSLLALGTLGNLSASVLLAICLYPGSISLLLHLSCSPSLLLSSKSAFWRLPKNTSSPGSPYFEPIQT